MMLVETLGVCRLVGLSTRVRRSVFSVWSVTDGVETMAAHLKQPSVDNGWMELQLSREADIR